MGNIKNEIGVMNEMVFDVSTYESKVQSSSRWTWTTAKTLVYVISGGSLIQVE